MGIDNRRRFEDCHSRTKNYFEAIRCPNVLIIISITWSGWLVTISLISRSLVFFTRVLLPKGGEKHKQWVSTPNSGLWRTKIYFEAIRCPKVLIIISITWAGWLVWFHVVWYFSRGYYFERAGRSAKNGWRRRFGDSEQKKIFWSH
jgi:hypothetical protein